MSDSFNEKSKKVWLRLALPIVVFNLLFLNFIRANGYFQASLDVFFCIGLFAVVGALYGLGMVLLQEKGRIVLLTGLLFFFLDVQFNFYHAPETKIWPIILISILGLGLLSWFLLKYLEQVILPVFVMMLLVTLLKPYPKNLPLPHQRTLRQKTTTTSSKLPIWIHVILDAHIGIEGIPIEFDPKRKLAKKLVSDYTQQGFDVFGKAFAQINFTNRSLRNLFTFSEKSIENPSYHIKEKTNKYFKLLHQRGYKIHVYQTDEVFLCRPGKNKNRYVKDCLTYHHQDFRVIHRHKLSTLQKISFLYGAYEKRSRVLIRVHSVWNAFRYFVYPTKLNWGRSTIPLVGMELLNWMNRELIYAKPGHAYIIHILLPHSPFVYDKTCRLTAPVDHKRSSRAAFRAQMYDRYLNQLQCVQRKMNQLFSTLKKAHLYKNATLIVHGDHGSRVAVDNLLDSAPPVATISPRSYLDHFSALFAIKAPKAKKGTYHSFKAPMSYLLKTFVTKNKLPQSLPSTVSSYIYLRPRYTVPQRVTMPPFPSQKMTAP